MVVAAITATSKYHVAGFVGGGKMTPTLLANSSAAVLRSPNFVSEKTITQQNSRALKSLPREAITSQPKPMKSRTANHCSRTSSRNSNKRNNHASAPPILPMTVYQHHWDNQAPVVGIS